jgi:hypothetical protein
MAKDEEPIDLNKLSQRELLILLHSDVKELKEDMKSVRELEIKVSNIETKNKVWAGLVGFFTALATIFFERQIR